MLEYLKTHIDDIDKVEKYWKNTHIERDIDNL